MHTLMEWEQRVLLWSLLFLCSSTVVVGLEQSPVDGYAELSDVTLTLSRHDAVAWIANWLWTHSSSTLDSDSGNALLHMMLDMLPDVEAEVDEYERFVNACLHYAFRGEEGCSNELHMDVDYEPNTVLTTIIELAQPLTERHWPWKTFIGISRTFTTESRAYAYVCHGHRCARRYLFYVQPCILQ